MIGALLVRNSNELLRKLRHEFGRLLQDPLCSYPAINVARDAYHLREWLWREKFSTDPSLQTNVFGHATPTEADYNVEINNLFPDFQLVREIANGSKHLVLHQSGQITDASNGGWDNTSWDSVPWDTEYLYIEVDGQWRSANQLLDDIVQFWSNFFITHNL